MDVQLKKGTGSQPDVLPTTRNAFPRAACPQIPSPTLSTSGRSGLEASGARFFPVPFRQNVTRPVEEWAHEAS